MAKSSPQIGRTIEYAACLVEGRASGAVEELSRPITGLACHTHEVSEGVLFANLCGTLKEAGLAQKPKSEADVGFPIIRPVSFRVNT